MESLTSAFTDEQCDYLLSLPDAELRQWLGTLPVLVRLAVRQRLSSYKPPRERCEQSLYEFVRQAWHIVEPDRPFIDGWHIRGICKHLEAVDEGKIRDLLINVPPGHCKSRVCNVFFPAWVWIHKPSARFLHASYAQELATRDSVDCRYVIESDREVPPTILVGSDPQNCCKLLHPCRLLCLNEVRVLLIVGGTALRTPWRSDRHRRSAGCVFNKLQAGAVCGL